MDVKTLAVSAVTVTAAITVVPENRTRMRTSKRSEQNPK
jgi:hypothetical protein